MEEKLFGDKEEGLTGIDKNDLKKKDVPFYFRERLRMKEKMNTLDGRLTYGLRKITVEPVIGNIKQNLGFREFLRSRVNVRRTEKLGVYVFGICLWS